MSLTSRKKRPLDRSEGHLRDAKLIVIATEGEKTEGQYFNLFHNLRLKVRIIPCEDSRSSPEYVLDRLTAFAEEYQLEDEDQLWLMVDVDRWGDAKLGSVCTECIQKNYGLAISNPCFEVWLYLHFADFVNAPPTKCSEVKSQLKLLLGSYNPSNLQIEMFAENVQEAIQRAQLLDNGARYPESPGTHVYKIAEQFI